MYKSSRKPIKVSPSCRPETARCRASCCRNAYSTGAKKAARDMECDRQVTRTASLPSARATRTRAESASVPVRACMRKLVRACGLSNTVAHSLASVRFPGGERRDLGQCPALRQRFAQSRDEAGHGKCCRDLCRDRGACQQGGGISEQLHSFTILSRSLKCSACILDKPAAPRRCASRSAVAKDRSSATSEARRSGLVSARHGAGGRAGCEFRRSFALADFCARLVVLTLRDLVRRDSSCLRA